MKGKLIVFEGTDGSGKATQAKLLFQRMTRLGLACREIDFPRYGNPFAVPVDRYLHGALGNRPGDVNAYASSTFFAVDRFASYKEDWGGFYEAGGILVANRYTTSNAVHQAPKLPEAERRSIGANIWTGSLTLNTTVWVSQCRIWYFIWICPAQSPKKCSATGKHPPVPPPISTSRTADTSAAAGKPRGKSSVNTAGRLWTVPPETRPAPRRTFTGRSPQSPETFLACPCNGERSGTLSRPTSPPAPQQQLSLLQPQLQLQLQLQPQPQLFPPPQQQQQLLPLPFPFPQPPPQQQHSRIMIRIIHRQEFSLLPLLNHINMSPLALM